METSQVCFAHGVEIVHPQATRPTQATMQLVLRSAWNFKLADAGYQMALTRYKARLDAREHIEKVVPAYRTESKPRRCTKIVEQSSIPAKERRMLLKALKEHKEIAVELLTRPRNAFLNTQPLPVVVFDHIGEQARANARMLVQQEKVARRRQEMQESDVEMARRLR